MQISIASITTTYNGLHLLPTHLDALLVQTRPLQEIVVVDDCSPDGAASFLAERYPQVTVLRMDRNSGTAGAWGAGLAYAALKKRHDWIVSFDQDSVPARDMVEKLLIGVGDMVSDESVGMLAPIPIEPETGVRHVPRLFNPSGSRFGLGVAPPAEILDQPLWFADIVITSGCMIRRKVIETIGIPNADFYMDFCDTEYSLRMRAAGFRIAIVSACEMSHKIGKSKKIRLLGKERIWVEQPPWREYYMARNLAYAAWQLPRLNIKRIAVARHILHRGPKLLLFSEHRLACLFRMLEGTFDGMRGRLGIHHHA